MYDVVGVDLTIEIMNLGLLILLTFKMYQNVGGDSFRLPPLTCRPSRLHARTNPQDTYVNRHQGTGGRAPSAIVTEKICLLKSVWL